MDIDYKKPRVVTVGGGTGQFTVLSGIKKLNWHLSAIVNMVDDGGSTGVLRDDLGVLPPGDVRQCLVALSKSDKLMRDLFNYRFDKGELTGHNFGNLFITSLEKITGSFEKAISEVSEVLAIDGEVIPVTTQNTHLYLKMKDGQIIKGQHKIDNSFFSDNKGFSKIFLKPKAYLNPRAEKAILGADIIIIGPGSFYSSLISSFLVEKMAESLCNSKARKIFICNLVNKPGQTDNFMVHDYLVLMKYFLNNSQIFDWVIYNNKKPEKNVLKKYEEEGENLVLANKQQLDKIKIKSLGTDLISHYQPKRKVGDRIKRNLIRHNASKLTKLIEKIYEEKL